MRKWDVLFVASLALLLGLEPAFAAGFYNLGANFQPTSPLSMPEYGYISGTAEAIDCPTGTYATGVGLSTGWVTASVRFICSDGSTTSNALAGPSAPNATSTCSGAGNDISALQINSHGYMNSVCYVRIGCRDGTTSQLSGSGAGGCGTWQTVQTCPPGYAITGATDHASGSTYFASLALTCRYTNRSPAVIGYWPMSETSGTTATDVSGNSNTGTYQTGSTLNQTGVIPADGKAVLFNGTSGYMSTATSMSLMAHHSISVWFKTTSATKMGIFGFENAQTGTGSTTNSSSLETETDGRLTFYFWNGSGYTITTTGTYKDGNWHHVVASIGLAGAQLWVDGSLVGQNTSFTSSGSYAGYWRLGHARRANAYFNGTLDNFAVYKGQLTSSEVADLHQDANLPYLYPFTTHTFTNASVTGRTGPLLAQVQSAYSSKPWSSNTAYLNLTTQGVQIWTVPETATYTITAAGAAGGNGTAGSKIGGPGRIVSGDLALTKGDMLYIVAGQLGDNNSYQAGGGGGSFVYLNSISASSQVVVAGGGGGATHGAAGVAGSTSASGVAGTGTYGGAGGTSGSGGNKGLVADGSAGTGTNGSAALGGNGSNVVSCAIHGGGGGGGGTGTSGAATFIGGLYGSATTGGQGGFGGGGAGGSGCSGGGGGGGGGGYSGGGGGSGGSGVGGGGGSNSGTGVTNYNSNVGTNTGAGYVTITKN